MVSVLTDGLVRRATVGGVKRNSYDPEVAAMLIVVEAQSRLSRQILDHFAADGVCGTSLAELRVQLDRLQATLSQAQHQLLPTESSSSGLSEIDLPGFGC